MNNNLNDLYGNNGNENNTTTNTNQNTGEDLNSMYNAIMTPKVQEEPQSINNVPQQTDEMAPSQSVINNQGLINPELQASNSPQEPTLIDNSMNNNQFINPQENTAMLNNPPIANQDTSMMNNNQFINPQDNNNMMNNPPIANQNTSMMTDNNNSNNMFNAPGNSNNQSIPNQPQESNNNQDINEEENLVEAFVGPAYLDFTNGSFNVYAFFLTSLYFFYRKMFLYGLAFFIGQTGLSLILGKFYIAIIVNLACGFLANKIYIGFARGKVKKLSKKYSGEELISKCEEKGGTSIGMVFLGMFVEFILALIVLFILMFAAVIPIFNSIETSRQNTMASTFKQYANEVKTFAAIDEVICNNSKFGTLKDGIYYVEIDTSTGSSVAQKNYESLLGNGGKSSWANADIKGYIKIVKTGEKYNTFINMSDNTHGTKQEISSELLSRDDIDTDVPYPTTPSGIKCSITD